MCNSLGAFVYNFVHVVKSGRDNCHHGTTHVVMMLTCIEEMPRSSNMPFTPPCCIFPGTCCSSCCILLQRQHESKLKIEQWRFSGSEVATVWPVMEVMSIW